MTNVRELYFKHKCLTRINSKPTFDTLHNMILKLNVNTSSFPSEFNRGSHSHVEIIIYPTTYDALAPMTLFVPTTHPGILRVDPEATYYVIAHTNLHHMEAPKVFSEY